MPAEREEFFKTFQGKLSYPQLKIFKCCATLPATRDDSKTYK